MIFIEGLPGSGKTTFSIKLQQFLTSKKEKATHYTEGMHNPLSLAWQSLFSDEEYHQLLQKYPTLSDSIKANTRKQIGKNVVAYTLVDVPEEQKDFYEYAKKYEVYHSSIQDFKGTYQKLYDEFRKTHHKLTESYIFECILLQNHVNQLMAGYHLSKDDIIKYFKTLTDVISSFNLFIIYIKQIDIKNTLSKMASERLSPNKSMFPDWIDMVIQYIESSPYGKMNDLKGIEGVIEYSTRRQELELEIINQLDIPYTIIELDENYNQVFEQIKNAVFKQ